MSIVLLNQVTDMISYYPVLIVLPIGIVGNIFSFYVYTRPNLNKKTNTGFLYAILCLAGLTMVLYYTLIFSPTTLFNYTVTMPCGVLLYLLRIVYCLVPWMQVVISFDRLVLVVFPHKKDKLNKKVLLLIMLVLVMLMAAANMSHLLSYPVTVTRAGVETTSCITPREVNTANHMMAIIWRIYVPMGIMIVLNLLVFRRLRKSKAKVAVVNIISQNKQSRELSNKQRKFIVSTLLIDLVFVIFYTPMAAYLSMFINFLFNPASWSLYSRTIANLFLSIALFLTYFYSASIFFIFLIFNRYFRGEAIYLLRLRKFFPEVSQTLMNTRTAMKNSTQQI